jgi:hypothetical protein
MAASSRPQAKSYDAAIADCSACLELDPSYFKAYRTRARLSHFAFQRRLVGGARGRELVRLFEIAQGGVVVFDLLLTKTKPSLP